MCYYKSTCSCSTCTLLVWVITYKKIFFFHGTIFLSVGYDNMGDLNFIKKYGKRSQKVYAFKISS